MGAPRSLYVAKIDKERLATGFWNRIESNQATDCNTRRFQYEANGLHVHVTISIKSFNLSCEVPFGQLADDCSFAGTLEWLVGSGNIYFGATYPAMTWKQRIAFFHKRQDAVPRRHSVRHYRFRLDRQCCLKSTLPNCPVKEGAAGQSHPRLITVNCSGMKLSSLRLVLRTGLFVKRS